MMTAADLDEPLLIELLKWTPKPNAGPLLGVVDVLVEGALVVPDIAVTRVGNKLWCPLPARPVFNASGNLVRDSSYQVVWEPAMSWSTRAEHDAFSAAVVDQLKVKYPRAVPRNCQFVPRRDDARPAHP